MPTDTLTERELREQFVKLPAEARERIEAAAKLAAPIEDVERASDNERTSSIRTAIFGDSPSVWDDDLGEARKPIPGGCDILLEGVASYFFGGRGSGKSTLVTTLGLSVAMQGRGVLVLDRENGAALTRSRVDSAIAQNPDTFDAGTLREHFDARHWPEFKKDWNPEDYAEVVAGHVGEGGVVAYDSVRELLRQLRLSANSDDDWSELYDLLATPLIKRGITPIFLDNIGHVATERPKGAGAKLDAAPQGYKVWSREEFTPEITGVIGVECNRSRLGDIGREWRQTLGGGRWELPTESTDTTQPTTWDLILAALADGEEHEQGAVAEAAGCSIRTVRRLVKVEESRARKEEREPTVKRTERSGHPTVLCRRAADAPSGVGF